MSITESIISSTIQGITEFLPISSSGHIVILSGLFGYKIPDISYIIYLHFASLLAVLFVLRLDLLKLLKSERRTILFVLIGIIPVGITGLLFREKIEPFFKSPKAVGYLLLLNGVWLLIGDIKLRLSKLQAKLNIWRSLVIGISQIFALLPGISRSGSTISCGTILGLDKREAYRFSFLLFIPVVIGVTAFDILESKTSIIANGIPSLAIGGFLTFFISVAALKILFLMLSKSKMYVFSIYCFTMGLVAILL